MSDIPPDTPVRWLNDDGSVFFEGTETEFIEYLEFLRTIPSAKAITPKVPPDQYEAVGEIVDRSRQEQGLWMTPDDEALEQVVQLLAQP